MSALRPLLRSVSVVLVLVGAAACGQQEQAAVRPPGILITTAEVATASVETIESSVGQIESLVEPEVAAEVAGRVLSLPVEVGDTVRKGQLLAEIDAEDYRLRQGRTQAEISRLAALISQQERLVERYETLAKSDFFARNALDDAQAQLKALRSQLTAADAQSAEASRNLARAGVLAPVDGKVSARMANVGDYLGVGAPIVRLSTDRLLRVTLPYPEALAEVLKVGLPVRLRSPAAPETVIEATITEIRPTVGEQNRGEAAGPHPPRRNLCAKRDHAPASAPTSRRSASASAMPTPRGSAKMKSPTATNSAPARANSLTSGRLSAKATQGVSKISAHHDTCSTRSAIGAPPPPCGSPNRT